jgi:hypothetical protein
MRSKGQYMSPREVAGIPVSGRVWLNHEDRDAKIHSLRYITNVPDLETHRTRVKRLSHAVIKGWPAACYICFTNCPVDN